MTLSECSAKRKMMANITSKILRRLRLWAARCCEFGPGAGDTSRYTKSKTRRRTKWRVRTEKRIGMLFRKLAYCESELSTFRPKIQPLESRC